MQIRWIILLLILLSNQAWATISCGNDPTLNVQSSELLDMHINAPQWMCGRIHIPPNSSAIEGVFRSDDPQIIEHRYRLLFSALYEAQSVLVPSAEEILRNPAGKIQGNPPNEWQFVINMLSSSRILLRHIKNLNTNLQSASFTIPGLAPGDPFLNNPLGQLINQQYQAQMRAKLNSAIADGWIHAGSHYFNLIRGGARVESTVTIRIDKSIEEANISNLLKICYINSTNKSKEYFDSALLYLQQTGAALTYSAQFTTGGAGAGGRAGSILAIIFGGLMKRIVNSIMSTMTTGSSTGDPLASMARLGSDLTIATEALFWSSLGAAFGLFLATSVMHCTQPLGAAMQGTLNLILPFATFMVLVVYVAAIVLALYVPMIPFMVFLFAALGWIILVVEAVVAAPLIALGFVIPTEDEIGKAGHALVILLGLFLRPVLMIVGFVLAGKLLRVGAEMLNFGFAATYGSSSRSTAFSIVAVLFIYSGIATALVHEAFSLIYVLPDKVLRWMGGQEETSSVKSQVQGLEGKVREGAKTGQNIMKKGLARAGKAGKGGGGGKPGGGGLGA